MHLRTCTYVLYACVPLQTELQRMSIRVEDSSKEIRNMRESFGLITNEIELIKSLLARLARHHGMDYEEEDNEK